MNILQLISSEGYFGAESMLVALARGLSGLGAEVVVGVFEDSRSPHTEVAEQARRQGLEVELVPCRGRWDCKAVRRIRSFVAERGVDVVHSHGYKADLYGWAAAWPRRAAVVATCHNWADKRPLMQTYAMLDRLVLGRADRVATPSPVVASVLQAWGVRTATIANGVDVERFSSAAPAARKSLGAGPGPLIGFVGRLVEAKGGAVLLEAAASVIAARPEARFVLVGEGPSRQEWQELAARLGIAGNVTFTGVRTDMPEVYAALDVVVLPSLEEAMPMCILEALAAARPVIATPVGGVPEVILPEETGLLTPPGEAAPLAAAILGLLRNPEQGRRLGKSGQARVRRMFSAEATANRYLELYREAVGGRARRAQSTRVLKESSGAEAR